MKALIIRDKKGHIYYVGKIEEVSELDYLKLKKEADEMQKAIETNLDKFQEGLAETFEGIEHDIKILKGEE